ncbi:MAG: amino acid permease [Vicinamibacterales bacterium]
MRGLRPHLHALPAAQHRRGGPLRLPGYPARRRRGVLRVHGLRLGDRRGAGSQNPQRDLPIGIMGSLAGCTVLYILVAVVLTGVVPYTQLNVPDPIAVGVDATGLRLALAVDQAGGICGLSTVVLVGMLAQTRIFYTMANDGLLPPGWRASIRAFPHAAHLTTIVTGGILAITLMAR